MLCFGVDMLAVDMYRSLSGTLWPKFSSHFLVSLITSHITLIFISLLSFYVECTALWLYFAIRVFRFSFSVFFDVSDSRFTY